MNNEQLLEILNRTLKAYEAKVDDKLSYTNTDSRPDTHPVGYGLCNFFKRVVFTSSLFQNIETRSFIGKYIRKLSQRDSAIEDYWFPLTRFGDLARINHILNLIDYYKANPIEDE